MLFVTLREKARSREQSHGLPQFLSVAPMKGCMNRIETVTSRANVGGRMSTSASDLHSRYRKWSFNLQMCEAVDECILANRTMYGWRPQHISIAASRTMPPIRANKTVRVWLLFACLLCTVVFLFLLISLAVRGLTSTGALLAGSALAVVLYEGWILVRRILRNAS